VASRDARNAHPLFNGGGPYRAADLSHPEGAGSLELQDTARRPWELLGALVTHKHSILVSRTQQETPQS
jgi:hypothetical protein